MPRYHGPPSKRGSELDVRWTKEKGGEKGLCTRGLGQKRFIVCMLFRRLLGFFCCCWELEVREEQTVPAHFQHGGATISQRYFVLYVPAGLVCEQQANNADRMDSVRTCSNVSCKKLLVYFNQPVPYIQICFEVCYKLCNFVATKRTTSV